MLILNAKIYRTEERRFTDGNLLVCGNTIAATDCREIPAHEPVWDAEGRRIAPGLLDVHTHGRAGYDFLTASSDALSVMAASYAAHGVTSVMPALASAPLSVMYEITSRLSTYRAADGEADFFGVHWEGRYLNPARRGAHAPERLAPLCATELEHPCFHGLRALHITAAYELDTDGSFTQKAKAMGATLGLGHTDASFAEARAAEENGVTSYTHLFNAMPPLHHRNGGALAAALMGNAFLELICDGIHVSPEMVQLAWRMSEGHRLSLISDSMEATGCPDGDGYLIAGNSVTVKNGIARTADGALAGSTLTLDQAVRNLMRMCKIPLEDALAAATVNPAKQMGVYDRVGSLVAGKQADLLVLEDGDDFCIRNVMVRGQFLDSLAKGGA